MENQDQVSHPSHRHWKSPCDSHIPTAPTTEGKWKAKCRLPTFPLLDESLSDNLKNKLLGSRPLETTTTSSVTFLPEAIRTEEILDADHVRSLATAWRDGEVRAPYKKRRADAKPHIWRTRPDPFEAVWPMLQKWLNDEPNTTAKGLFLRLNTEMPNRFKPGQIGNLQRRISEWRTAIARRLVLGCNYDARSEAVPDGINTDPTLEDRIIA